MTTNEFGKTGGRPRGLSGLGFGAGPKSAVTVRNWPVDGSNPMVRAPFLVATFSIRAYFPPRLPTKLMLPSPLEVTASLVLGSKARPLGSSQPAIGHSAITLLAFESTTAIVFLSSMLMYMRPFPSGTGVSGLPLRGDGRDRLARFRINH